MRAVVVEEPAFGVVIAVAATDVVSAAADVVFSAADVVSAAANVVSVAADVVSAAADVVSVVADVVSAAADVVSACRIVANALVLCASSMVCEYQNHSGMKSGSRSGGCVQEVKLTMASLSAVPWSGTKSRTKTLFFKTTLPI
ncbi:unnamed protein product [Closterium sp. NIES-54]